MIQEINQENIQEALNLVNKVFSEFVAKDYSDEGKKTFEDYLKNKLSEVTADVVSGHKKVWGYTESGKIIGVIALKQITHIALFFVDATYHGKGIGRELFDTAVKFVKENHKDFITVNSSPYAVPIYESLGFIKSDERQENNGIIYIPMKNKNIRL